jgi:hypothetical protein
MTRFAREPARAVPAVDALSARLDRRGDGLLGRGPVGEGRGRRDPLLSFQPLAQLGVAETDVPRQRVSSALLVAFEVAALGGLGGGVGAEARGEGEQQEEGGAEEAAETDEHEAEVSRCPGFARGRPIRGGGSPFSRNRVSLSSS